MSPPASCRVSVELSYARVYPSAQLAAAGFTVADHVPRHATVTGTVPALSLHLLHAIPGVRVLREIVAVGALR